MLLVLATTAMSTTTSTTTIPSTTTTAINACLNGTRCQNNVSRRKLLNCFFTFRQNIKSINYLPEF